MTHREAKLATYRLDIKRAESRVREAKKVLQYTFNKGQEDIKKAESDLVKAKVNANQDYDKQKEEVAREEFLLEREQIALKALEDNLTDADGDL